MARVRLNKRGEIVLTIDVHEARMTGDALAETIHRHGLDAKGATATVMRAIDRGLARAAAGSPLTTFNDTHSHAEVVALLAAPGSTEEKN